ncbi:MAG: CvpA family protein [Schleiferiaceae bacterium]|jgi:uncharacterized membrane protein required for colicin V production|nr:CvpA family protein [Schleiferiaceae bacterium]
MQFNWVDILLILPLFTLAWYGYSKGVLKLLSRVVGFAAAIITLVFFSEAIVNLVNSYFNNSLNKTVIQIGVFLGVLILFNIIGTLLTKSSKALYINSINKVLGLVLGLFVGSLFSIGIVYLIEFSSQYFTEFNPLIEKSKVYNSIIDIIEGFEKV